MAITGDITTKPRNKVKPEVERPRLYKVILLNDDCTPREFAAAKAKLRLSDDRATAR